MMPEDPAPPPRRRLYLDTSAYLCILLAEEGSDRIGTESAGAELLLTFDLCSSNVLPPVATPRSLDLAHLRTALWFHATEPIDRFVTMDAAQEAAAKELGLPV
jgi:hypothetical protein